MSDETSRDPKASNLASRTGARKPGVSRRSFVQRLVGGTGMVVPAALGGLEAVTGGGAVAHAQSAGSIVGASDDLYVKVDFPFERHGLDMFLEARGGLGALAASDIVVSFAPSALDDKRTGSPAVTLSLTVDKNDTKVATQFLQCIPIFDAVVNEILANAQTPDGLNPWKELPKETSPWPTFPTPPLRSGDRVFFDVTSHVRDGFSAWRIRLMVEDAGDLCVTTFLSHESPLAIADPLQAPSLEFIDVTPSPQPSSAPAPTPSFGASPSPSAAPATPPPSSAAPPPSAGPETPPPTPSSSVKPTPPPSSAPPRTPSSSVKPTPPPSSAAPETPPPTPSSSLKPTPPPSSAPPTPSSSRVPPTPTPSSSRVPPTPTPHPSKPPHPSRPPHPSKPPKHHHRRRDDDKGHENDKDKNDRDDRRDKDDRKR